jgi:hypothetical protein
MTRPDAAAVPATNRPPTRTLPTLLCSAGIAALLVAGCHPPRSPREAAESKVDGVWTAESAAVGEPRDSGSVAWRHTLQEQAAGKVDGSGSLRHGGRSTAFTLSGQRGESEVTLDFALSGERVKYHGSLLDPRTLVGDLQMPGDTLTVTFTRP